MRPPARDDRPHKSYIKFPACRTGSEEKSIPHCFSSAIGTRLPRESEESRAKTTATRFLKKLFWIEGGNLLPYGQTYSSRQSRMPTGRYQKNAFISVLNVHNFINISSLSSFDYPQNILYYNGKSTIIQHHHYFGAEKELLLQYIIYLLLQQPLLLSPWSVCAIRTAPYSLIPTRRLP